MKPCEIADCIKNHDRTDEIINVITSDFEYYNSLLLDGELTINYKKIKTRTTFLGLAAMYSNNEVLHGLLKKGVPADGLDIFLYKASMKEDSNYRPLDYIKDQHIYIDKEKKYWSTRTEVVNTFDEYILFIPWSTPLILAILAENAEGLKLLLEYGATCDLRTFYFANALSLCENEEVMNVLLDYPDTHIHDTTANILIVFNLTLAKFLHKIGVEPEANIISNLVNRMKNPVNTAFFNEHNINASSKLWEDYYLARAEACMEFYKSIGYDTKVNNNNII